MDLLLICTKFVALNKKWLPYILIALMAVTIYVIKSRENNNKPQPKKKITTDKSKVPTTHKTNRDRGFDRRISYLKYSDHAKCRMQCRKISQAEVEEIMKDGKINYAKSDLQNSRCPRYAVEGVTIDEQRVRIVYAQCNETTTVVTVIDLETDFECHCPGDDDNYTNSPPKNRN